MTISTVTPRERQRGVAAVEFGILIIPLTLMLFGLSEYGRAIYQYNTLVKATRDASRYLSKKPDNGPDGAKCLVLYGKLTQDCPESGPDTLVPGLTKGMVSIINQAVEIEGNSVNLVTVTISDYKFQSVINFPIGGLGAPDITFGDISNTMRQAL